MWGVLIPVTLLSFLVFEPFRRLEYILPASGVLSIAVFSQFPWLVRRLHGKPLYYEDLEDAEWLDPIVRMRFQHAFTRVLIFANALGVIILVQYGWDAVMQSHNVIEVIGILGGLYTWHQKFISILGRYLLKLLYYWRTRTLTASIHTSSPTCPQGQNPQQQPSKQ